MSPHAEAYLLGATTIRAYKQGKHMPYGMVFIPRSGEYLTQEVWDRMVKALAKPATTSLLQESRP